MTSFRTINRCVTILISIRYCQAKIGAEYKQLLLKRGTDVAHVVNLALTCSFFKLTGVRIFSHLYYLTVSSIKRHPETKAHTNVVSLPKS